MNSVAAAGIKVVIKRLDFGGVIAKTLSCYLSKSLGKKMKQIKT